MRLTSIGATVSLILYGVVTLIVVRMLGKDLPTSWSSLISFVLTFTFTILLLWVPATVLMLISVILGYPYNLYAGLASTVAGLAHIALVVWSILIFHDKTLGWFLLSFVGTSVGALLCYLGIRLINTYRKKKLVEFEPLLRY